MSANFIPISQVTTGLDVKALVYLHIYSSVLATSGTHVNSQSDARNRKRAQRLTREFFSDLETNAHVTKPLMNPEP